MLHSYGNTYRVESSSTSDPAPPTRPLPLHNCAHHLSIGKMLLQFGQALVVVPLLLERSAIDERAVAELDLAAVLLTTSVPALMHFALAEIIGRWLPLRGESGVADRRWERLAPLIEIKLRVCCRVSVWGKLHITHARPPRNQHTGSGNSSRALSLSFISPLRPATPLASYAEFVRLKRVPVGCWRTGGPAG